MVTLSFLIRASVHVSVVNQITFNFLLDFSVPVAYNQGTRPISCWFSVRPARLHPDGSFAINRTPATAGQRRWGRAPAGYRSACSSGRSPPAASLLGPCSAKARTWCHLRKMFYALSSLWSKAVCPFGRDLNAVLFTDDPCHCFKKKLSIQVINKCPFHGDRLLSFNLW